MTPPAARPVDPWPLDLSGCSLPDGCDAETLVAVASSLLWKLSGRRYGLTVATVRPPSRARGERVVWWETDAHGRIHPLVGRAFCQGSRMDLPGPIAEVYAITIDGQPFTDFRVDNWRTLVRTDGENWPATQDLDLPATEPGTWSVHYARGRHVPVDGIKAGNQLACELALAEAGDDDCALPLRVQTIARQGVTINLIDPADLIEEGRTGLYFVDLWLKSENPNGLQARARVHRADAPRFTRTST